MQARASAGRGACPHHRSRGSRAPRRRRRRSSGVFAMVMIGVGLRGRCHRGSPDRRQHVAGRGAHEHLMPGAVRGSSERTAARLSLLAPSRSRSSRGNGRQRGGTCLRARRRERRRARVGMSMMLVMPPATAAADRSPDALGETGFAEVDLVSDHAGSNQRPAASSTAAGCAARSPPMVSMRSPRMRRSASNSRPSLTRRALRISQATRRHSARGCAKIVQAVPPPSAGSPLMPQSGARQPARGAVQSSGTGSNPPSQNGWQRARRRAASQLPRRLP